MIEFEKTPEIADWLGAGSINLFGKPFAGKDSQGNRLAKRLDGVILGGGKILRGSNIPAATQAIMDRGELIPTVDFVEIVHPFLGQPDFDNKPLILSAVGRLEGEEEGVIEALEISKHPLKAAVYLPLEDKLVWERFEASQQPASGHNEDARGIRSDDTREKIAVRLEEFRDKTIPVIDFYREQGLLIEVDATLSKNEVEIAILTELAKHAAF